jgi:hypothetical protein
MEPEGSLSVFIITHHGTLLLNQVIPIHSHITDLIK